MPGTFSAAAALAIVSQVGGSSPTAGATKPAPRAVFAVFEGARLNVYARSLDAAAPREQLLLSQDAARNANPEHVLRVRIAPGGERIAYMHLGGPISLVDAQGKKKVQIAQLGFDFHWSPDGTRILYAVQVDSGLTPDMGAGKPLDPWGYEWRLLDVTSGHEEIVATPQEGISWFGAWAGQRLVFVKSGFFTDLALVVLDLKTRRRVEAPSLGRGSIAQVRISPNGVRSVVRVDGGDSTSCPIYEITPKWTAGRKIAANLEHMCGVLEWNTDDDFFYGKGTGPKGRLRTTETSESGYYALFSVYRYSFKTGGESAVLSSDGKEVYRFLGLLPNKLMVVSIESNAPSPRHRLETRALDGSNPKFLRSSERPMMFVGWLP